MRKFLRLLRSLFSKQAPPAPPARAVEPSPHPAPSPEAAQEAPPAAAPLPSEPSLVRGAILLVGEDLAWLATQPSLAGRPLSLASAGADPLTLLASRPHDLLVASYRDPQRSLELLRSAAAASTSTLGVLRADRKELGSSASPFPLLPRIESVEILDDQFRTCLAAAAWQRNPATTSLLRKITRLPTLPAIYTQITAALQNQNAPVDQIANLVALEPAVSAKLLQLANSPLLGMRGRITSVRDATGLLGLSRLRSLVLATCLFRQFDPSQCAGFSMAEFEESSFRIATWAAAIVMNESGDKQMAEMAFTAGLLHNFGMLLLAVNLPEDYHRVLLDAKAQGINVPWAELQTFGVANTEIAGGILAAWGLPFPIVNAVGWSPVPSSSEDIAFTPLTAVHTAIAAQSLRETGMYTFDEVYVERLQFEPRLRHWCEKLSRESLPAEE